MKKLFIIFLLAPLFATAQDCKLNKETDPFTKETKLSTGFINFEGGSVTIDADSKELIFLFSIEGVDRCFDNNSTVDVFFEGIKSKTAARNAGTMNCEGLFQIVYKNSNSNPTTMLQRILTRKITSLVFTFNNGKQLTITPGAGEQQAILSQANCLVTEAKTLIK